MKKITILSVLTFAIIFIISSCGKETQNTTQGGGVFKLKVTFRADSSASISCSVGGLGAFGWDKITDNGSLKTMTSNEVSVTSGQNLNVFIMYGSALMECNDVTIEGIQNGNVIKTYKYSMGYDGDIAKPCKEGTSNWANFIIN